jgi:hypothetical protein
VIRSVGLIVAAIQYVQPSIGDGVARSYATVIQAEAKRRSFDPFTLVAMTRRESRFHASLIYDKLPREYSVGLVQINVIHYPACKTPALIAAPGCQSRINSLLHGPYNLKIASSLITANRRFCRKKTGKPALFARWLASFQGHNRPGRGVWCNMKKDKRGRWRDLPVPESARSVIRYRRRLIRALARS